MDLREISPESENYRRNLGFFARSMFLSPFSHRVLRSMTPTDPPATRWWSEPSDPITSVGRWRVHFFPTRFQRVGSRLGTNLTRTDPWTALMRGTSCYQILEFRSSENVAQSQRTSFSPKQVQCADYTKISLLHQVLIQQNQYSSIRHNITSTN